MALPSQVLVLGAPGFTTEELVENIVRKVDASQEIAWTTAASSVHRAHGVTISTKYYAAPVVFHVHSHKFDGDWAAYEACLLVWDTNDSTSWCQVQDSVDRMGEHSYDVLLAVAFGSLDHSNIIETTADWCLEHGVEQVVVTPVESSNDDPISTSVDGTTGVDRIVEALECTMWTSMEMKNGHAPPSQTSSLNAQTSPCKRDTQPRDAVFSNVVEAPDRSTSAPSTSTSVPDKDRESVEEFESLLQEVQAIRSQMHGVSDDERRKRAADMAMRLWEMMGAGDSDSGRESDSD
ncbi:hypothetical protein H310_10670, partial [Aphanomyces invadans]